MNEGIARRPARRWPLLIGLAILALTVFVIPVAAKSDGQSDLAGARNATARFHKLDHANAAGYSVRMVARPRPSSGSIFSTRTRLNTSPQVSSSATRMPTPLATAASARR